MKAVNYTKHRFAVDRQRRSGNQQRYSGMPRQLQLLLLLH